MPEKRIIGSCGDEASAAAGECIACIDPLSHHLMGRLRHAANKLVDSISLEVLLLFKIYS